MVLLGPNIGQFGADKVIEMSSTGSFTEIYYSSLFFAMLARNPKKYATFTGCCNLKFCKFISSVVNLKMSEFGCMKGG